MSGPSGFASAASVPLERGCNERFAWRGLAPDTWRLLRASRVSPAAGRRSLVSLRVPQGPSARLTGRLALACAAPDKRKQERWPNSCPLSRSLLIISSVTHAARRLRDTVSFCFASVCSPLSSVFTSNCEHVTEDPSLALGCSSGPGSFDALGVIELHGGHDARCRERHGEERAPNEEMGSRLASGFKGCVPLVMTTRSALRLWGSLKNIPSAFPSPHSKC